MLLPRAVPFAVAVLAVLKTGAAYVPIDPSNPPARLRYMVDDTAAPVVLTCAELAHLVPDGTALLVPALRRRSAARPGSAPAARAAPKRRPRRRPTPSPEDLAYVIYTSGSTGRPKGVMVTHRGVCNYVRWARPGLPAAARGHAFRCTPRSGSTWTVTGLLGPAGAAAATVLMIGEHLGPEALGEALRRQRTPSGWSRSPRQLDLVNHQLRPAEMADRTRCFVIGGENLRADQVAPWRAHAPRHRAGQRVRADGDGGRLRRVRGRPGHTGDGGPHRPADRQHRAVRARPPGGTRSRRAWSASCTSAEPAWRAAT